MSIDYNDLADWMHTEVCKNDLAFFVRRAFSVVEPETKYMHNWHIDVYCHELTRLHRGTIRKLDVNIGPRMLKSFIGNVCYPMWVWLHDPSHKFINASYVHDLAKRMISKRLKLFHSDFYQSMIDFDLITENQEFVENNKGGFFYAVSSNGKVTGEGGNTLIGDDLLDVKAAFSKAERTRTLNWIENVFYDRVNDQKNARRLNINHRVHLEDPSHFFQTKKKFKSLVFQLVKTGRKFPNSIDYDDPRDDGDLLFPKRFGDEEKNDIITSKYLYSTKWQQDPKTLSAGMVEESWLTHYQVLPGHLEQIIMFADTADSESVTSDYNCFGVWGKCRQGRVYLIDWIRFKGDFSKQKREIVPFAKMHDCHKIEVEPKASGRSLVSALKNDKDNPFPGIKEWEVKGLKVAKFSKVERLDLCLDFIRRGLVLFPERHDDKMNLYTSELLGFTREGSLTGNDDQVDMTTMAILKLLFRSSTGIHYA